MEFGLNGLFVHGGTNCTRGWNFVDIVFSDSVIITRFYDFAGTSLSYSLVQLLRRCLIK